MRLTDNDFQLFGLPETQAQSRPDIDARWKALQAEVHPDRFAAEGAAAQRVAMQWAMRVNEAYQRLRDPLSRAGYLCELRGAPVQAENNTQMPAAFLMQQMQWREALEDADSLAEVEVLAEEVGAQRQARLTRLGELLDVQAALAPAAQEVRALMFIDRLLEEIDTRLQRYEDAP